MTSAVRIGAALVGTLIFVVAEPAERPVRGPSPARAVAVEVERVKGDDLPGAAPDGGAESATPGVVRRGVQDVADVGGRSLQDHDDVEESDLADRARREDGDVGNGDFEGGTVSRGHNITTSSSDSGSAQNDD